jgi:hypothetical protein
MNERILKLREQASQWVVANHQPQDSKTLSQKEIDQRYWMYEQKFAELIVKECANVAAEHEALDIYEEIREHFGVEQ